MMAPSLGNVIERWVGRFLSLVDLGDHYSFQDAFDLKHYCHYCRRCLQP